MKKNLHIKIILGLLIGVVGFYGLTYHNEPNPHSVEVVCDTTKGPIAITVFPEWSPRGAERFLQLVDDGFFSGLPIFRCIDHFICQFGATLPRENKRRYSQIADDVPRQGLKNFKPGYLSFAGSAPNSRATHIFIALAAASSLGTQPWETPFAVIHDDSMRSSVSRFTTTYGESAPNGKGPDPQKIEAPDGAQYLQSQFPQLDFFKSCSRKKP